MAPRAARPSERSQSWKESGIRVEIDGTKLNIIARKGMERELVKLLDRIKTRARFITSQQALFPYSKTGNMRRSIQRSSAKSLVSVNQAAVRGAVTAGSRRAPYTKYVHNGAARHVIHARPSNPTGMLRFTWKKAGHYTRDVTRTDPKTGLDVTRSEQFRYADRLFIGPSVSHPGSKPKPFLVVAARDVTGYGVRRVR